MTKEQIKASMDEWGAWMGGLGSALVDGGAPFGNRICLVDDGSTREAADLNGYSVIEAEDLEAAKKLTEGHPHFVAADGRFSIEIFEFAHIPSGGN